MKNKQEGSAMVVVMCVMVVTVALSLSLLLTASVLVNNAVRSNNKEQCRINAVSISEALIQEIKGFKEYSSADEGGTVEPSSGSNNAKHDLRSKLKTVVTTDWFAYDENAGTLGQLETKGKDYFTYNVNLDGLPGTAQLEMYWIDETGEQMRSLDMSDPETASGVFGNVVLYLKVTSTVGQESSTVISRFQPVVQLISFTEENGIESKMWKSWRWSYIGHEWERGAS